MNKTAKFLSEVMKASNKTCDLVADRIHMNRSTLRACIRRGKIPAEKFEAFAAEIGVGVQKLREAGVVTSRDRNNVKSQQDILPVLKAIAGSKAKSVTREQLLSILQFQSQLKKEMTPVLVSEILGCL